MKIIYIILLSVCGLLFLIGIIVAVIRRSRSSSISSQTKPPVMSLMSTPIDVSKIIKSGKVFQPESGKQYKIKSTEGYVDVHDNVVYINQVEGNPFIITKTTNGFTIQPTTPGYLEFGIDFNDDGVYNLNLNNQDPISWDIVYYKDTNKVLLSSKKDGKNLLLTVDGSSGSPAHINGKTVDTYSSLPLNDILFEMV